ncbi:filamentous hemagglutinin N-terminal domain-containing protein [Achromobacter pestifer]|uniref:Filamentous hemagglutinin N-terminal domain-containing protein n=1 Tax=Achromobacter pestifer TaxID=1353889 RepID=A0A7D4E233_9BURK|nr:filamentous hemagglutinin N-terminal domain-containing protein [Achromobacter pestifer]QKH36230.1 filamentous hemagglutinin N-terminal domain-containing protein [Achromobacter pestifer]
MNKIYALVWNEARQCWNVARESARCRGKRGGGRRGSVMALALIGLAGLSCAHAAPMGGTIGAGNGIGDIHTTLDQKQVSINQHTNKLIIDWNSFNIGADERVTFNQPGSGAIALNKVNGLSPSSILGRLDANGQVFLVNPNGIVFGKGAEVNVGGLVASTKLLSDADFHAGNHRFAGSSEASVLNQGVITARDRGSVALLGAKVSNQGVIQARLGRIALAAGSEFTVNFDGSGLLDLQVNGAALSALVENGGMLRADGGQVLMSARAAGAALRTVVNSQGIIEARTLQGQGGKITLDGGNDGLVVAAGKMNASALSSHGNGGTVEMRGQQVKVRLGTEIDARASNGDAGTWRIASGDIGVGASAAEASASIHADTIARNLAASNIVLESTVGDVALNGPIAWSSGNALSLVSAGGILANGSLTASGQNGGISMSAAGQIALNGKTAISGVNGSLSLQAPQDHVLGDGAAVTLSGAGASFRANGQRYAVIQNLAQLQEINRNLGGLYVLGNNLSGRGKIDPIGGAYGTFSGVFDGLGNKLSGFSVSGAGPNVGLFAASSGSIRNTHLVSMEVTALSSGPGTISMGGLVGRNSGQIVNVTTEKMYVRGNSYHRNVAGGLVGTNVGGSIDRATAGGTMYASSHTVAMGGLVGENLNSALSRGSITRSIAKNAISGSMQRDDLGGMGGLVGVNRGLIADSSSHANTQAGGAGHNVGGLVGNNLGGDIERSFSAGRVQNGGSGNTGGLVGLNGGNISEAIAYGNVSASSGDATGGLVGRSHSNGVLRDVKAAGDVSDYYGINVGGLVGANHGRIDTGEAGGAVNASYNRGGGRVGGLAGYNSGTIEASVARGKATGGSYGYVGGLVGYNSGMLATVAASGNVTAGQNSAVGGLVGANEGMIVSAMADGNAYGGYYSHVGGVVGENGGMGEVLQSSSAGMVSGARYAFLGGLAGFNQGEISYSSASGQVKSDNYLYQRHGGLAGVNHGVLRANSTFGLASLVQPVGLNQGVIEP